MRAVADKVRAVPSRAALDERPTSVTIRFVTYVAGRVGSEGPTRTTDVVITPTPRCRELNQREIAGSAGRYTVGDVRVGPITPTHTTGGYSRDQLAPLGTSSVKVTYLLAGDIAGEYSRVDLETSKPHSWFLVLRRMRTTP